VSQPTPSPRLLRVLRVLLLRVLRVLLRRRRFVVGLE
jgi:hypothetical protein